MKKAFFLSLLSCLVLLMATVPLHAQQRLVYPATVNQGTFLDYGGIYPSTPSDSLQVSDSIAYIIPLNHTNDIAPYLTWYWNKIGSGTATITLSFQESNDGTIWHNVLAGQAQSAYTKSYTLSASGDNEVSFQRDTALVMGRYIKIYYITSSTASVKGKLVGRFKANIK